MSAEAIADLLYRESGLKGLSGISHDMRELEASDQPEAQQAIEYFVFRIRRELGGLAAALKGLDAMVFCGGIGEHAWRVRERVLEGMEWIGIELDRTANQRKRAGHFVGALARARVRDPHQRGSDDRAPDAGGTGPRGGGRRLSGAGSWIRRAFLPNSKKRCGDCAMDAAADCHAAGNGPGRAQCRKPCGRCLLTFCSPRRMLTFAWVSGHRKNAG